jgi:hypothetical protein
VSQIKLHARLSNARPPAVSARTAEGSFLPRFLFSVRSDELIVPKHKTSIKSIGDLDHERISSRCGRCRCGLGELRHHHARIEADLAMLQWSQEFHVRRSPWMCEFLCCPCGQLVKARAILAPSYKRLTLCSTDFDRQGVASLRRSRPRNLRGRLSRYRPGVRGEGRWKLKCR